MNEQPRRSSAWGLLASIAVLLVAATIFLNRQQLLDRYSTWSYQPSAEIAALSSGAGLTEDGRFYFYASRPELNDRASFNSRCTHKGEKTAILGCYVAMRIYIFNVTDERLDGIKEVTAAHEMLHAAYDRLSDKEKAKINQQVEAQLLRISDPRIKNLVALYDKTEPGERANELHSILGTEVRELSPELEAYYKRYFVDRQQLVSMSERYEAVFKEINTEQQALVDELNELAGAISQKSNAYNEETSQLNADIATFNQRASNGGFVSQSEFAQQRKLLTNRQATLQAIRSELNAMIAAYNDKRERLETLNGQAEELNRSINSQLTPVPSI